MSSICNLHAADPHDAFCTVCEVQQLSFSVQGSVGLPSLTTGKSCEHLDTCASCLTDLSWAGFLPLVACELTEPKLLPGTWKLPSVQYTLDITQSDLSVKLSDLVQTEVPELYEVLQMTGTDVTWSIPESSIMLYLAGGSFQVQMLAQVLDLDTSTIMSKVNAAAKEAIETLASDSGYFTDNTLYSDTINIGEEVVTLLKAEGTSVPSWLAASGAIEIGDVSNKGEVCDTTPRKFAVAVTGLTADELTSNAKTVAKALADLLTQQSKAHSNMPVLPSQITNLKMCGTDSKTLCGDMSSGAGFEAGGLNDYLAQLAAAQTKVPISSANSFTLTGIVAKDTDFTCSAAAEKAGGCPKPFSPSGGGGGGGGSGGGGNNPSGGGGSGGGNSPSVGPSASGPTTHALTAGDIAAIVVGTFVLSALIVLGVLRARRGSFQAVFRGYPTSSPRKHSASASTPSAGGQNVLNPVA